MVSNSVTTNCRELGKAYQKLNTLFGRINLNIEPVKTEAMHFHPIRRVTGYHNWETAGVRIAPDTVIKPTNPLRWLGIWWDPALSFTPHIERMRSKGLSTLAALRLLEGALACTWGEHALQAC